MADGDFQKPVWEADEASNNCTGCDKGFTMIRRRHHCRGCGRLFCEACSSKKFELPEEFGLKGKQRVCDNCYFALVQANVDSNPDEHPPKPDYPAVEDELKTKLQGLLSEDEATWQLKTDNKGVKVYIKKLDSSALFCVRTTINVECSVAKAWGIYNQKDLWGNWQPDMAECRTIEAISDKAEVLYVRMQLPVIANRDSVVFTRMLNGTVPDPDASGVKTLISTSVVHPLGPQVKKVVRAHVNMSCTTFTPVTVDGQEHCKIESMVHANPRGLIPPKLVNTGLSRATDSLASMAKYMKESDFVPEAEDADVKHAAL